MVAQSIKELAEGSADNAEQITKILDQVTELSEEAVKEADNIQQIISEEQALIVDTQAKFEALSDSIDTSITEIQSISDKTILLSDIKNDVTQACADLGAVSQELGASSEEVSANTTNVAESLQNTMEQTEEMIGTNNNLVRSIEYFK